jgi:hypothetical protein
MSKRDRQQTAIVYFSRGMAYVSDADFLFRNNKINGSGLLLLQGIELLFKAFIIIKEQNKSLDELIIDFKKEYGHNYVKAYKRCLELDDDKLISNKNLEEEISFLNEQFASNYVEYRYPSESKMRSFSPNIFSCLKKEFIAPLRKLTINYLQSSD